MKKLFLILTLLIVLFVSGCNTGNFRGQIDTTLEYSPFTGPVINEQEYENLLSFLYEAEIMMRKPVEEAVLNESGTKIFKDPLKTKNDLFIYYQTYLSNELADTMARKLSDLSKSVENRFLALSNDDLNWFSIYDAEPSTIKVIQHTTVQSVVEMKLKDTTTRLQYTIMKDRLGQNPKIVQKTVLYN